MNREQAAAKVATITQKIEQYSAVSHDDARSFLGDARFEAIKNDKVRGYGPREGYFYPWNVADYAYDGGVYKPKPKAEMAPNLLEKLKLGMTRDEVVAALGIPDDTGGTSRKHKTPCLYLYGTLELAFNRPDGLVYVMDRGESGDEHDFLLIDK